jgi:hypothetical protein
MPAPGFRAIVGQEHLHICHYNLAKAAALPVWHCRFRNRTLRLPGSTTTLWKSSLQGNRLGHTAPPMAASSTADRTAHNWPRRVAPRHVSLSPRSAHAGRLHQSCAPGVRTDKTRGQTLRRRHHPPATANPDRPSRVSPGDSRRDLAGS